MAETLPSRTSETQRALTPAELQAQYLSQELWPAAQAVQALPEADRAKIETLIGKHPDMVQELRAFRGDPAGRETIMAIADKYAQKDALVQQIAQRVAGTPEQKQVIVTITSVFPLEILNEIITNFWDPIPFEELQQFLQESGINTGQDDRREVRTVENYTETTEQLRQKLAEQVESLYAKAETVIAEHPEWKQAVQAAHPDLPENSLGFKTYVILNNKDAILQRSPELKKEFAELDTTILALANQGDSFARTYLANKEASPRTYRETYENAYITWPKTDLIRMGSTVRRGHEMVDFGETPPRRMVVSESGSLKLSSGMEYPLNAERLVRIRNLREQITAGEHALNRLDAQIADVQQDYTAMTQLDGYHQELATHLEQVVRRVGASSTWDIQALNDSLAQVDPSGVPWLTLYVEEAKQGRLDTNDAQTLAIGVVQLRMDQTKDRQDAQDFAAQLRVARERQSDVLETRRQELGELQYEQARDTQIFGNGLAENDERQLDTIAYLENIGWADKMPQADIEFAMRTFEQYRLVLGFNLPQRIDLRVGFPNDVAKLEFGRMLNEVVHTPLGIAPFNESVLLGKNHSLKAGAHLFTLQSKGFLDDSGRLNRNLLEQCIKDYVAQKNDPELKKKAPITHNTA